jgi:hypothetical protein
VLWSADIIWSAAASSWSAIASMAIERFMAAWATASLLSIKSR